MINQIKLIRNVGQYDSVSLGAATRLARMTLVYGENGRGKTTLCAIMRSLSTGDPLPIVERRRLGASHPPHVVLDCSSSTSTMTFDSNSWNQSLPSIAVFDDAFIDANVYSGLAVDAGHRQNLHELILGAQGVMLGKQLQASIDKIESHNRVLREKAAAIPVDVRGSLEVDEFCALPANPSVEAELLAAERKVAAAQESDPIRIQDLFDLLTLPAFDLEALDTLLARNLASLDAAAATQVQEHIRQHAAESWISKGMQFLGQGDACPFCAQPISSSEVILHYQAYFGAEYGTLKQAVATAQIAFERAHAGDVTASFERKVRVLVERRQFWSRFGDIPEIALDTAAICREWRGIRETILELFKKKQAAPLERIAVPDGLRLATSRYAEHRAHVAELNASLTKANDAIVLIKEQAASANIAALTADVVRLRASRARHQAAVAALCSNYLLAKRDKATAEKQRDAAKDALSQYRASAFPGFQDAINGYLQRFNAGFRLDRVTAANTRGGPTCSYNVLINNVAVAVAGGAPEAGEPAFKNTLSAGDRNTLALAFFFASLDQDPGLATKIVVIDDPVSSLDEHRSLTTVQEMRRLAARTKQLVLLSHSKGFLCKVWEGADKTGRTGLQVIRDGSASALAVWNVDQDSVNEQDRRHALLREYARACTGNTREVARGIRPLLEAYLRAACPEHFPPGTLLGNFREKCSQRCSTGDPILSRERTDELRNITEYANRFHHDTNAVWETETISDGELNGYVQRALKFVAP